MKVNANGFYSLNGNNVIDFKEGSKAIDICEFLETIKAENDCGIIIVLDNLAAHHAKITAKKAEELGIILVFLPKYSPDLNPIEQIWKSIKKSASIAFIESEKHLEKLMCDSFVKLAVSKSFAKGWIEKFGEQIKSVYLSEETQKYPS